MSIGDPNTTLFVRFLTFGTIVALAMTYAGAGPFPLVGVIAASYFLLKFINGLEDD